MTGPKEDSLVVDVSLSNIPLELWLFITVSDLDKGVDDIFIKFVMTES